MTTSFRPKRTRRQLCAVVCLFVILFVTLSRVFVHIHREPLVPGSSLLLRSNDIANCGLFVKSLRLPNYTVLVKYHKYKKRQRTAPVSQLSPVYPGTQLHS